MTLLVLCRAQPKIIFVTDTDDDERYREALGFRDSALFEGVSVMVLPGVLRFSCLVVIANWCCVSYYDYQLAVVESLALPSLPHLQIYSSPQKQSAFHGLSAPSNQTTSSDAHSTPVKRRFRLHL